MWTALSVALLPAGLVAALWAYNRIRFARAEAAHPPAGSFITVEGTKLHDIRRGEGTPVVLLHGGVLWGNDFARVMDKAAARGYEAIAFDRPGYGYSERPPRGKAAPADQARLIHEALKQLKVEKPIIVGHSWSGLLALIYALRYPGDVAGVVTLAGEPFSRSRPPRWRPAGITARFAARSSLSSAERIRSGPGSRPPGSNGTSRTPSSGKFRTPDT